MADMQYERNESRLTRTRGRRLVRVVDAFTGSVRFLPHFVWRGQERLVIHVSHHHFVTSGTRFRIQHTLFQFGIDQYSENLFSNEQFTVVKYINSLLPRRFSVTYFMRTCISNSSLFLSFCPKVKKYFFYLFFKLSVKDTLFFNSLGY